MKIIKKLCVPLFSLVLLLGCFAVSQMSASAYTSKFVCTTHRVYMNLTACSVSVNGQVSNGVYLYSHSHTYSCPVPGCWTHQVTESLEADSPCISDSAGGNTHSHNYSTTWGGWRKISSCRLPD